MVHIFWYTVHVCFRLCRLGIPLGSAEKGHSVCRLRRSGYKINTAETSHRSRLGRSLNGSGFIGSLFRAQLGFRLISMFRFTRICSGIHK